MIKTTLGAIFFAAVLAVIATPAARADVWDKQTTVTFKQPVEVPGTVLAPGQYVFRLVDNDADRNIVQIFNVRGDHLYATILGITDYREEPSDRTILNFEERPAGSPEAIREWFYPGETTGVEFVYPKSRAMELAKASNHSVPAMPSDLAGNLVQPAKSVNEPHVQALKKARLTAVTPAQKEVQMARAQAPQTAPSAKPAQQTPKHLPKTASELFGLLVIGLVALGVGLLALFFVHRVS